MGSGAVESGNKLVVEARLKSSGMHWAREHANPMLGLRNAVCSDRWDEAWEQIYDHRMQQAQEHRMQRPQHLAALSQALSDNDALLVVDALPRSDVAESTPAPVAILPVEKERGPSPGNPGGHLQTIHGANTRLVPQVILAPL